MNRLNALIFRLVAVFVALAILPACGGKDDGDPNPYIPPPGDPPGSSGWTEEPTNPVLEPTALDWDSIAAYEPTVLKVGPSTYWMWYDGYDGGSDQVGFAVSTDGINWTKSALNPVLTTGGGGSWDELAVGSPCVIDNGTELEMWYVGINNALEYRIGHAVCAFRDGVTWVKTPAPVLTVGTSGSFDDGDLEHPHVILDGGMYKMWYTGFDAPDASGVARIGYAMSVDGVSWTKYAFNPVIDLGGTGAFDQFWAASPCVIKDGGTYRMWYLGGQTALAIGYADSTDGIHWTKFTGNPVLDVGGGGAWNEDNLHSPFIIKDGDTFKMWYGGEDAAGASTGYATNP